MIDYIAIGVSKKYISIDTQTDKITYNAQKKSYVFSDPEEQVRAGYYVELIEVYQYDPKFIDLEVTVPRRIPSDHADIVIFEDEEHKHVFQHISHEKHVPNQLALLIYQHIQQLYNDKKINGEQLLFLNAELQSFTDICGACERIKNTPIPFSYSVFIKKFIFFYIMTLPFGYVFQLGFYIIPVVAFIFYVLASLELIAEEIEDPFGGDQNDVPTRLLAQNIHRHVAEII